MKKQEDHELQEDIKTNILIPFVLERSRDSIRELFENQIKDNIYFLDYSPELFYTSNKDVFLEVLNDYIEENYK